MSHIMCSEENISSYLDMIRGKKWDKDVIALILDSIIPKSDKTKIITRIIIPTAQTPNSIDKTPL